MQSTNLNQLRDVGRWGNSHVVSQITLSSKNSIKSNLLSFNCHGFKAMNLWAGFNEMMKTDNDELLESHDDMSIDEFQQPQKTAWIYYN
jgi:hypothetical protein